MIIDKFINKIFNKDCYEVLKRKIIGIEQSKEYMEIIISRLKAIKQYKEKLKKEAKK